MSTRSPDSPTPERDRPDQAVAFLEGDGEMVGRIRSFDWSKTPIGPIASWSIALRTMVRLMMANPYPMLLWWGPEYVSIYNDPYRAILGNKHPWGLSLPVRECWKEIWHILQPLIDTPFHGGPATWNEDILLELNRHGFLEEGHFTIGYSPVPDESAPRGIGGVLATVHEITGKVVAERRVAALRDLGANAGRAKTAENACALATKTLAGHDKDVPFILLYLIDPDGRQARLAGAAGVETGATISPPTIWLNGSDDRPWPLSQALRADEIVVVDHLDEDYQMPIGPWSDPPQSAAVVPVPSNLPHEPAALMVIGISARLRFDAAYRDFLELLRTQIASAIANARSYEVEKKRAEALSEIDRAKTRFFSNVSHEFRTPLTLMLGPLEEALATPGILPRKIASDLGMAQRNGMRLLKLVNTLLDFSRLEAGRIHASFEPTDLPEFTSELASNFRSACDKAGLRLNVNCPPFAGDEKAYVDRDMWEKIVLNLVSNAFKFTLEGQIEVSLQRVGGHARLTVRDTGVGIPPDELPRMFERFHRIKDSRGRTHEGTGIGLAFVHELAKLHGGTVKVESVLDVGSTFTVMIPLGMRHLDPQRIGRPTAQVPSASGSMAFVEEALRSLPDHRTEADEAFLAERTSIPTLGMNTTALHDRAIQAHGDGPLRILWADDNADMRDYVRRILVAAGFEVQAVTDGESALAAARSAEVPPDLVLADIMMPKLGGHELLKELRADARLCELPVILLSARAGEESRIEGMQAGAEDYLVKPFSARELVARVETHVRMARRRRDERRRSEAVLQKLVERERAARADAEQAGRLKDEFLATLSHELRTPLNAILGWSQLLDSSVPDAATARDGIRVIHRNARAQANLIADLLDMSRIISGKIALNVTDVRLEAVIAAAIEAVRQGATAKGVRITTIVDAGTGAVRGDAARLEQVVWNLLSNAVKFTPTGGCIQAVLASRGGQAEIVVSDTGVGIDPKLLPHVFEKFRQGDSSPSRPVGGLGLGLAIVKHVVEIHGGAVEAQSGGHGQGATFKVRLPLATAADRSASEPDRSESTGSAVPSKRAAADLTGVHALVVDDQPDARDLIRRMLETKDARVVMASSADEALTLMDAHRPHVVLCDIGMPGKDGYEFVKALRDRGDQTPALAVTAFARPEDEARALTAGYQGHLSKPIEPDQLLANVAALAKRGRPPAETREASPAEPPAKETASGTPPDISSVQAN